MGVGKLIVILKQIFMLLKAPFLLISSPIIYILMSAHAVKIIKSFTFLICRIQASQTGGRPTVQRYFPLRIKLVLYALGIKIEL